MWVIIGSVALCLICVVIFIRRRNSARRLSEQENVCGRPNCVKCTFRRRAPELPSELDRVLAVYPDLKGSASQRIVRLIKDISTGENASASRAELQNPTGFLLPELAARRFWDDEFMMKRYFPWLEQLEAATDAIRDEYLKACDTIANAGSESYAVYEQSAKPAAAWSALEFYNQGLRNEPNCSLCPRTVALLDSIPDFMKDVGFGFAYFSILDPGMKTAPAFGLCNIRLRFQLPLMVPSGSAMVVGKQRRPFVPGKSLIFDDSFLHSVENNNLERDGPANGQQVVLLFDVWHPGVTPAERQVFKHLFPANPEAF
eukprot:TRINITY_DN31888_c0_g1_i1.p1 TRINITY_DN31888_c0_g1~~TRINITY_DN31888_c0_g1_i1.p1  ORF type:complete len:329 (+),score=45.05 TRINITY_DN31888_c0_g1_i1:45-989(+)